MNQTFGWPKGLALEIETSPFQSFGCDLGWCNKDIKTSHVKFCGVKSSVRLPFSEVKIVCFQALNMVVYRIT
jgi:hypothetical protein